MIWFIVLAIVIILAVLALSLLTTSKGYAYKHTIDPLPQNDEHLNTDNERKEE
ncbi:YtzI protein [Ornithinibacillus sp. L9]|uniref:YtzI protein n=1 Tax=Ornithinibacillus caprae TaxID=2678566 RepID=A0A6N8FK77_9BACI|nr:YtzI protein [Ornithinibacillus caprae]MUK89783.1 YtzI protein [Ornithinibacillus caprae]